MTSRDRVLAAMQRQPVDHVPCVLTFNPLTPVQREGVWNFPWPEGASTEDLLRYQLEVLDKLTPSGKSLFTGPSSTFHLWNGPEPTREAVRTVFHCFGETGLILAPCVSAHSIMPWESTEAMVDEWKRRR